MAAGIVYHNITTATGVTFALACWVPDTSAPDVGAIPVSLPIKSDGTVADITLLTAQLVANDAVDTGNPIKVGAMAVAGLSTLTLVAAADRVNLNAGLDGAPIVRTQSGLEDIVSGNANNTDGTATQVIAAGGAGIKQYLTSVTLTNMSNATVYVEMKSGTTVKWTCPVPANGGYTFTWPQGLPPNAANEAWNFDPSAATTTIYCSATAFKSKI